MDPAEHYDMAFNGAAPRVHNQFGTSPGRWSGQDGAWTMAFAGKVMGDLVETFKKYPNIPTIPGGASLGSENSGIRAPQHTGGRVSGSAPGD